MNRLYKLALIILSVFIFSPSYSQKLKKFSNTREAFYQEISGMLTSVNSKTYVKRAEDLLELFYPKWMSERFHVEERDEIIYTANIMLQEKMRAYPDFYDFIVALTEISYSLQPKESVIAWLRSLEPLIKERSNKGFLDYLHISIHIVKDHTLYKTRTMKWRFEKAKYHFKYDSIPLVVFDKLDLICTTRKDSSVIENTKGVFNLNTKIWKGNKGRINWLRVQLDEDKVFADIIGDYLINMKETNYTVDSVSFKNKYYFDQPVLGHLFERVLSSPPSQRTTYPRFESFFKGHKLEDIFNNVNYEGGIAMEGSKLKGSGTNKVPAVLEFFKNDDLFVRIKSLKFVIQKDRINSSRAAIAIYFKGDSIYHPGLNMKFVHEDKKLILYRSGKGIAQSPFYDTYHKIDMYCEALYWTMGEENISFEMIHGYNPINKATFESANYYSDYEYYKLQGIDPINPLDLIKNYTQRYKTDVVNVSSFAQYINKSLEQASVVLFNLAKEGFLVYDVPEGKATVKKRLFDYLDAKAGLIDYDLIRFNSVTTFESNAVLNVDNFDLKINGVSNVFLSDSQNVIIYPYKKEIVMKKNRDFLFSGSIIAGLLDFHGNDCSFEYDSFRINLPHIDSLSFKLKLKPDNKLEKPKYVRVKNVIADLSGEILIDRPWNKSGLKYYKDYPIFNSINESYVFYDYSYIRNGVYDRDRFYYQLEPFTIKRLDNFSTDDLRFKGFLASDSLFPQIEEHLVVLPDYSLGFDHLIPSNGYPVYKAKGRFYSRLKLSNDGLIGEGQLDYLASSSVSSKFIFYLDSLRSVAGTFDVKEQKAPVEFPTVKSEVVDQFWNTDTNIMYVSTIGNPFNMYNNNSSFDGTLLLSPEGMYGNGQFTFSRADIVSNQFNFMQSSLTADTSDFRLHTITPDELAITTTDYKTYIDFDKRTGKFTSIGKLSLVEFPFNKYVSSMDEMNWNMDQQQITLLNNVNRRVPYIDDLNLYDLMDFDFTGSEFVSTREDQDSLAFFCQKATYDMNNYKIFAEGVKIIKVADAAVFPGDGKVEILKDAVMTPLEDAYVIADTSNKYHMFYNATVNIDSKHKYNAKGSYDYIDKNAKPQEIKMTEITVDNSGSTYANGFVPKETVFFLSPSFYFTGDVILKATRKNLEFEGGFRINQDCYYADESWTYFDTVIAPDEIVISVDEKIYNLENERNEVALLYSSLRNKMYRAFFDKKENISDEVIISSHGILKYNDNTKMFSVANPDRFRRHNLEGNLLSLSTINCEFRGYGNIDMGVDLTPLRIRSIGRANHYIIPDSTNFNVSLILDFYFDDKLLGNMVDSMNMANLTGVNLSDDLYKLMLVNLLDEKEAGKTLNDIELYGYIRKFPDELIHTMVLTDVNLSWNPESSSYISYGQIGVGNILDMQVNKYVDGYIEIEKRRGANAIHMYFELSEDKWYFFSYRNRIMQAYSSNQSFNDALVEIDASDRTIKVPPNNIPYEFVISTRRRQVDFVRKMEKLHKERKMNY